MEAICGEPSRCSCSATAQTRTPGSFANSLLNRIRYQICFSADEFSTVRRLILRLPMARSSMRPFLTARLPIARAPMARAPTAAAPIAAPASAAPIRAEPLSAAEKCDFTGFVMVEIVDLAIYDRNPKRRNRLWSDQLLTVDRIVLYYVSRRLDN